MSTVFWSRSFAEWPKGVDSCPKVGPIWVDDEDDDEDLCIS